MPDCPVPESAQVKPTVTSVLFQPKVLAAGVRLPVITGLVLSIFMPERLAGVAVFPAASVQLPVTVWLSPSVVTVTSSGLAAEFPVAAPDAPKEATPEVLSVQTNLTVTSLLFQPFPFATVWRLAVSNGLTESIFTVAVLLEPPPAPALPRLSVAVQLTLWLPSPVTDT